MSCLDNIISIRGVCDNDTSLSGLDLMDAPELSPLNLSKIANEEYISWKELATNKLSQATKLIRNDLMSFLAANNIAPNVMDTHYDTGVIKTSTTYSTASVERGLTLYKNMNTKGKLRKTIIHKIKIYPLNNANDVALKIYDQGNDGTITTYSVDLVANQLNTFDVDYTVIGTYARVVLDGTDVSVASSYLTCFTGCNGTMPNDCGYTKGFYDDREIGSKEGYGIILDFSCTCNYEQLLCDMAQLYIGELVYMKTRVLLLEEHLRSNRLNNWVVYDKEETKAYLIDLENQYRNKWNAFAGGLPNILAQYQDSCLNCRGIKWVNNI